MKHKKANKIFKYSLLVLFITFFSLYISQSTGYFEYQNQKKTGLTESQIKAFEQDVKEGKEVDLNNYINFNNQDYDNGMSKLGYTISSTTEKYVQKIIDSSFKALAKLVG